VRPAYLNTHDVGLVKCDFSFYDPYNFTTITTICGTGGCCFFLDHSHWPFWGVGDDDGDGGGDGDGGTPPTVAAGASLHTGAASSDPTLLSLRVRVRVCGSVY